MIMLLMIMMIFLYNKIEEWYLYIVRILVVTMFSISNS